MTNFILMVKNILEEQGKNIDDLFKDNIISKNTFYKYSQRNPSLSTLLKIANYLETSVDYLYELSDENNFKPYSNNQANFYNNLISLITTSNISIRKFCKDLNYAKDNVIRYKKGISPSVRTLFEIAKYFNCTIDDLLMKE